MDGTPGIYSTFTSSPRLDQCYGSYVGGYLQLRIEEDRYKRKWRREREGFKEN